MSSSLMPSSTVQRDNTRVSLNLPLEFDAAQLQAVKTEKAPTSTPENSAPAKNTTTNPQDNLSPVRFHKHPGAARLRVINELKNQSKDK